MFPHYPASSEWATVGGYVAARGSGVLSTRYGKIEDLVLSLRVALAAGELIDTVAVPAPRRRPGAHAALHRLGGNARDHHPRDAGDRPAAAPSAASSRCVPERRGRHRGLPAHARRRLPAVGDPHVRRGGDAAHALPRRRRAAGRRLRDRRAARASRPPLPWRGPAPSSSRARRARASSTRRSPSAGGTAATSSTSRRTTRSCPRSGARSTSSRPTRNIVAVHQALQTAVRDRYATAGPPAADALLALVPLGHDDLRPLPDPGRRRGRAARCTTRSGTTASPPSSAAGGVMNDHHGVGLKLAPYMAAQHGAGARRACAESSPRSIRSAS